MRNFLLLFIFFHLYSLAYSQSINGIILDEQTKIPIEFASIYFNSSFVGTTSDLDGNFQLDISRNTSMPLTISAIGYYSITLTDYSTGNPLIIYLSPKVYEINEIVLKGKSYVRQRRNYLKFFKNEFIGKTSNVKHCKILNEQDITFNYENAKDTLKAFALKPIVVDNYSLGYSITYYLDKFELYRKTSILVFSGNIIFNADLITEENKEEMNAKRTDAFLGSRMHFFRALWANKLKLNGFNVLRLGERLDYKHIVFQEENKKFLSYPEDLEVVYDTYLTQMILLKDKVYFDQEGYFDPSGIRWEGDMGRLRIADWLPYEYDSITFKR